MDWTTGYISLGMVSARARSGRSWRCWRTIQAVQPVIAVESVHRLAAEIADTKQASRSALDRLLAGRERLASSDNAYPTMPSIQREASQRCRPNSKRPMKGGARGAVSRTVRTWWPWAGVAGPAGF